VSETSYAVHRNNPRFVFIAEAEMIGGGHARVAELSTGGCYLDSINPLPKDSECRFHIRYGCSSCEFSGRVIYTHAGLGMGISFTGLTPEQRSTLDVWLDELSRKLS